MSPMSQLDTILSGLAAHPGVDDLLLLGGDGLPIRHMGGEGSRLDVDTVAAMVPGLASAAQAIAHAAERGGFATAVVELEGGVVVVSALSADLLLALFLRTGVGFAPLLRELRSRRAELAELL